MSIGILPVSDSGDTQEALLAEERPLAWSTELPTEPGWYWIRHPQDGDQASMRHLFHMGGILGTEIPPKGFSSRPARLNVLQMQQGGYEFYGPLRVPV